MIYGLPKKISILFFILSFSYLLLLPVINYPITSVLKPLSIVCLLVAVFVSKASSLLKKLLAAALIFSLVGDVALTLPISISLYLGIAFFMLAHFSYILLFFKMGRLQGLRLLCFLPVLLFIGVFMCYLLPHLEVMKVPVIIYLCVLTTMVFSAFQVRHNGLVIGSGALLFMLSDLTIALTLFMFPNLKIGFVTMLTYYLAQYLLVSGVLAEGYRSCQRGENKFLNVGQGPMALS